MAGEGEASGGGRRVGPWLLALCLATLAVKLVTAAPRGPVGHGDVAHYVVLARSLVEGRGMWVDYLATWLAEPTSIRTYGAAYWMPMPAWIAVPGMWVRGSDDLRAASDGMIVLTSIAPLLVYAIGRDAFGSRRAGMLGAVLAAAFHLFVDKATMPLTHGAALVFGGTALWAVIRSLDDRRFLWLAGAAAACAQLNRSDGILWLPTIVAALWLAPRGSRTSLGALWRAAVAYLVVMGPFLAYNLATLGTPWPGSLLRVTLLTSYPELYSLPERLTLGRWLDRGPSTILLEKAGSALANVLTFVTGLASGGGSDGADKLATWFPHAMVALAWIGARPLFQRRFAVFWCHAALQWLLYSFVFTLSGVTSFRPTLYALYPVFLVLAGRGAWIVTSPARERPRLRRAIVAGLLAVLCAANVAEAVRASHKRAFANQKGAELTGGIVRRLVRPNGLDDARFLVSQTIVHRFHAQTRLPAASIPYLATPEEILAAGRRVGATHLLLDESPGAPGWPALGDLGASERFERVDTAVVEGRSMAVYRLVDP